MQVLIENSQSFIVGVTMGEMAAVQHTLRRLMQEEKLKLVPSASDPARLQSILGNQAIAEVLGQAILDRCGVRTIQLQVIPDGFKDVQGSVKEYVQLVADAYLLNEADQKAVAMMATSMLVGVMQTVGQLSQQTGWDLAKQLTMASCVLATTLNAVESVRQVPVQKGGDLLDIPVKRSGAD